MSNYGFTSAGTSYDDEDRLTGFARASGTFTQSWSLTSVGDWNSITTNGTAQNRTHFLTYSRHPYTDCTCPDCSTSSSSLSPPASGLLPDFDNKLKSADVDNNGSNDVTFQYDALGRRVARQGTSGSFVYVQHDQQTIADYGYGDAPSSPTHRYVYASYIDEPVVRKAAGTIGTIHYLHRNQQYSITAVTTSSGSVAERYAYTAYGQPTILDSSGSVLSSSAINNRYTYTGREWDATLGLYHFRARWMSGLAGRFMGRDPIGFFDGFNLFQNYFAIDGVDPTGLRSDPWHHLLPWKWGEMFAQLGFDINHPRWGWELPEDAHIKLEAAGWGKDWDDFFLQHENNGTKPTVQQVKDQLLDMFNDPKYQPFINLGERPIKRYPGEMQRKGWEFILEALGKLKNGKKFIGILGAAGIGTMMIQPASAACGGCEAEQDKLQLAVISFGHDKTRFRCMDVADALRDMLSCLGTDEAVNGLQYIHVMTQYCSNGLR